MTNRARSIPELPSLPAVAVDDLLVVVDTSAGGIAKKATVSALLAQSFSGDYNDLINAPMMVVDTSQLTDTQSLLAKPLLNVLYVSKAVNIGNNGSMQKPFNTIQAALDFTSVYFDPSAHVVIVIAPGDYHENVAINRSRVHLMGYAHGVAHAVMITGNLTVATTTAGNGVDSETISVENVMFTNADIGTLITLGGEYGYTFAARKVQVIGTNIASRGLVSTNSSAPGIKVHLTETTIETKNSASDSVRLFNTTYALLRGTVIEAEGGAALTLDTSNVVVEYSQFTTNTGAVTINVLSGFGPQFDPDTRQNGSIAFTMASGSIVNRNINGEGLAINLGATANLGYLGFAVGTLAGSGYAISGPTGAFLIYGTPLFLPGTKTVMSPDMTIVSPSQYSAEYTGRLSVLTPAPLTSKGTTGDKKGQVAFDGGFIYYCTDNYTGNNVDIWRRLAWDVTTW